MLTVGITGRLFPCLLTIHSLFKLVEEKLVRVGISTKLSVLRRLAWTPNLVHSESYQNLKEDQISDFSLRRTE